MAQVCFQKCSLAELFRKHLFSNFLFEVVLNSVRLLWCTRIITSKNDCLLIFQKKLRILEVHLKSSWSSIETFPKSLRKVTSWQKFSTRTSHHKERFVWTLSKGTGSQAMASNTFYLWVLKHILLQIISLIILDEWDFTLQTIKCLLIVPNPESALNEEAGKLLLEHYDDYFSRAKMFTDIHARPVPSKCGYFLFEFK